MMLAFLFFSLLVNSVNLQQQPPADEDIFECVKNVAKTTAPMDIKKRPTIDPSSCFDLDTGSCSLFTLLTPDNHVTNRNNDP